MQVETSKLRVRFTMLWSLGIIHVEGKRLVVEREVLKAWRMVLELVKNNAAAVEEYQDEPQELAAMALTVCGYIVVMNGEKEFNREELREHVELAKLVLAVEKGEPVQEEIVVYLSHLARQVRTKNLLVTTTFFTSLALSFLFASPFAPILFFLTPLAVGFEVERGKSTVLLAVLHAVLLFAFSYATGGKLVFNPLFEVALTFIAALVGCVGNLLKKTLREATSPLKERHFNG